MSNRLALIDTHTLSCEAGGVTFVPIPGASTVDHVGLMSVELPPTIHKGDRYSVRVRQITGARFGAGRQVEVSKSVRKRVVHDAIAATAPAAVLESFVAVSQQGFLYRRTIGAFGFEIPVSTKALLLPDEERTLSILRHIAQSVPLETKWWPVFRRYVDLYAGRVAGMGGDPTIIVPTGDGDWRHPGKWQHPDVHEDHDHDRDRERADHCPDDDDRRTEVRTITGKVVALRYDHFGDFTGFVVETEHDQHVAVHSTERRVERLAREAWATRAVVRVGLQRDDRVSTMALSGAVDD